jgi:virginiamycin B lyase
MTQRSTAAIALAGLAALATGCSSAQKVVPALGNGAQASSSLVRPATDRVKIRQFTDLPQYSGYYGPAAIAQTAGSLWVADDIDQDFGENVIVQIAPSGKMQNAYYYPGLTSEGASFQDIAVGSDGNLWITDSYNGQIVRMTTSGTYTNFPIQNYSAPGGVVSGPQKASWFTVQSGTKGSGIGRITTQGRITVFPVPEVSIDIAAGPDGALWFTEPNVDRIGRMTAHGKVTEYSNGISSGSQPYSIVPGPDGALWFTERTGGRIGRITTSGKVTEYSSGITSGEQPFDLAPGPDGAIWFTEYQSYHSYQVRASKIGRITMRGRITEYSRGLDSTSAPTSIVAGPDGRIWFVESFADETGRVRL